MQKLIPNAISSGLLLCFAFIALRAFGSEPPEKEVSKVFRDNNYNGWVIPFIQASPSGLSLGDDLFDFGIKRSGDNLSSASVTLKPKKTEYHANPRKDSGVAAWPTTKITTYHDLNGDGEFDFILKSLPSKERPNGPNDHREFIIMDDSMIEIKSERARDYQKEFISKKGGAICHEPRRVG